MGMTPADLLPPWPMLLVIYGITYGIQNKLPFLYGRRPRLDDFLGCTYCVGTHSGWVAWVLVALALGGRGLAAHQLVISCLLWALLGGPVAYLLDVLVCWVESAAEEDD